MFNKSLAHTINSVTFDFVTVHQQDSAVIKEYIQCNTVTLKTDAE